MHPELIEKGNRNKLISYYWLLFDSVDKVVDIHKGVPAETITRNLRYLIKTGAVKVIPESKKDKHYLTEFSIFY